MISLCLSDLTGLRHHVVRQICRDLAEWNDLIYVKGVFSAVLPSSKSYYIEKSISHPVSHLKGTQCFDDMFVKRYSVCHFYFILWRSKYHGRHFPALSYRVHSSLSALARKTSNQSSKCFRRSDPRLLAIVSTRSCVFIPALIIVGPIKNIAEESLPPTKLPLLSTADRA